MPTDEDFDILIFPALVRCIFGAEITEGMAAEIGKAKKRQMTIRYFTEGCEETTDGTV